jgi:hypothetical protein
MLASASARIIDKGETLSNRLKLIESLVDIRGEVADMLKDIEKRVKEEPVIHYHVIKCLCDRFKRGFDGNPDDLLSEIVKDPKWPASERLQCLSALERVVNSEKWTSADGITYEMTKEGKAKLRATFEAIAREQQQGADHKALAEYAKRLAGEPRF